MVTALAGHALTWYMSYTKNCLHSWAVFKRDFLKAFGVQRPQHFHLTKLINRQRMPNESPKHYAMEMKKMADKCSDFSDEQLIGVILKGINDQRLFTPIYSRRFDDFDDFMSYLALRVEGNQSYDSFKSSEGHVFAMEPMNRALIPQSSGRRFDQPGDNRNRPVCYYCRREGHFIREWRTLCRHRESGQQQRPNNIEYRRPHNDQQNTSFRANRNNSTSGQVFRTGLTGHQNFPPAAQNSQTNVSRQNQTPP